MFKKTKLFREHQIIQIRATTPTKIEFSPPSLCPLANSLAYDMGFGGDNLVRYMNHSHRKWGVKGINPERRPQPKYAGSFSTLPCKNLSQVAYHVRRPCSLILLTQKFCDYDMNNVSNCFIMPTIKI